MTHVKRAMLPKCVPWYAAQLRIAIVQYVTLPVAVNTAFWHTWAKVFYANK